MKLRLLFKALGLAVVLTVGVAGLGCSWLGRPHIEKPLEATSQHDPVKAAPRLHSDDQIVVRLDTASTREEYTKTVDEYGSIELPFVGKIKVVGLTPTQVQEEIQKLYVPRYYGYLVATVQSQTPRVIYVTGEIRGTGGKIPYRDDMTLFHTIIELGGFSDFADRHNVVLTRGDRQLRVDCVDIERHPQKDIPLFPDDTIKVPRTVM